MVNSFRLPGASELPPPSRPDAAVRLRNHEETMEKPAKRRPRIHELHLPRGNRKSGDQLVDGLFPLGTQAGAGDAVDFAGRRVLPGCLAIASEQSAHGSASVATELSADHVVLILAGLEDPGPPAKSQLTASRTTTPP